MAALALLPLTLATPSATPFCAFEDALFPPYYVAYKTAAPPKIDGVLDEPEWAEVEWTTPNRDICGPSNCSHGVARFGTKQKVRWDDEFLYVAAFLVSLSPAQLLLGPTEPCSARPFAGGASGLGQRHRPRLRDLRRQRLRSLHQPGRDDAQLQRI